MTTARVLAALALSAPAWAYSYYVTDNLATIDPAKWSTAGAVSPGSAGLAAPDPAGGSLISRVPIPDGSAETEIRATLRLAASGGTYTLFLQATPDSRTAGNGAGAHLAFEMQNPQFDANGYCAANFLVFQRVGGQTTLLTAFPHACRDGMTLRMAVHGGVILLWPDQGTPVELTVTGVAAGQPGIGAYATPAGNAISQVQLGSIDRTAPASIDTQKIGVSAFRTRVDVQWPAVSDDPAGAGLADYWILRDGQYFMRTTSTMFQDMTVKPGETHGYTIAAVDQHYNFSTPVSFTVTTPAPQAGGTQQPATPFPQPTPRTTRRPRGGERLEATAGTPPADSGNGMDPRRTGVRALGSYWGAAGEQIDTVSGNLNFSLPVIHAQARGGWSVTFRLSYNSQMWRQDSAGTWFFGQDVGYGLGWILQAGSIMPVWTNTNQIDHYLYIDSTGAEYSLSVNTGGVWTSLEGTYVSYDSTANKLYFPDGSFWLMGSQSASVEQDAGTLYPTIIEDANGNQIIIDYAMGSGATTSNTSARITGIHDCRGDNFSGVPTYYFTYDSAHLDHFYGLSGTPDSYKFTYATQSLYSPFTPSNAYGTTSILQSVANEVLPVSNSFQYDPAGSGEMIQLTNDAGGVLQWQHRTFTYAGGISIREVQSRSMTPLPGSTSDSWSFTHDDTGDSTQTWHSYTMITDAGTGTSKYYGYSVPITGFVLPAAYEEIDASAAMLRYEVHSWTQDVVGNVYSSGVQTWLDLGPAPYDYSHVSSTSQTRDKYGNVTVSTVYDYGNQTAPLRTYNYTYLTGSSYISHYIRNRLTQATVTINNVTTTIASNAYDSTYNQYLPNLINYDYYGRSGPYGNLTATLDGNQYWYFEGGTLEYVHDGAGRVISSTLDPNTNYSLPSAIAPGNNSSLATNASYASSWAVTQVTDPNGNASSVTYDNAGRPSQSKSVDGATTYYVYTYNPNAQTANTNADGTFPGLAKRTTTDGFGRVIKVETGYMPNYTMTSVVDTQYAPCACSPLGKLYRVSQPHAPGATPVWTTYAYDGSGRTLSVTAPDGSVTRYAYAGNQTTVTDPAGNWKTTTTDALGNLISVTEPNPAGGANFVTTYIYDAFNHLTNVTMIRPEGTQTRTFQYNGLDLVSATNPENGTVAYTYDASHKVLTRTDAKNQQTQYTYDQYGRVTQVLHGVVSNGVFTADSSQTWTFAYDTNIRLQQINTTGRLAEVTIGSSQIYGSGITYEYIYSAGGRISGQKIHVEQILPQPIDINMGYTWNLEGKLTAVSDNTTTNYGGQGYGYRYQWDSAGRVNTMLQVTCLTGCTSTIATATYGPANEMTSLSYGSYNETRTYNNLLQLTRQTIPGVFDTEYVSPPAKTTAASPPPSITSPAIR